VQVRVAKTNAQLEWIHALFIHRIQHQDLFQPTNTDVEQILVLVNAAKEHGA
jgi:hypothetical protein